jgi:hypothetical protein
MTKTAPFFLLAAALSCLPAVASATGNLDCSIDDANLKFTFEALFGHGIAAPLLQPRASFESKNPNIHPSLRHFEAGRSFLKQQWFVGRDVKLLFYAETEGADLPFASVGLKIEAVQPAGEDFAYDGTYVLTIQPAIRDGDNPEPVTIEGRATCSAG